MNRQGNNSNQSDNYNNHYNQYSEYTGFNSGFLSGFENRNNAIGSSVMGRSARVDRLNETLNQDKKMRFRLEAQEEEFIYKPDERQFTFYQICQFAIDKKYHVRKLFYNEYADLIKTKETHLKKDRLDKFIKKCPEYKYTIYPAYNLDVVGYPEANEILTAQSRILNEY